MGSTVAHLTQSSALDALRAGADRLAAEDVHQLTDAALGEDLVELRAVIDRLEAQFVRRVGAFDRKQGYAASGAIGTPSWLRTNCRLSASIAAEQVRVARHLVDLADTARAFEEGEISYRHAAAITRTADEVGLEIARDAQPILLQAARRLDPQRLRLVTRHLRHVVDPDGALDAWNRDFDRRRLYLSQTWDGMFILDGVLDPEGGALLRTALEAIMGPRRPDDQRTAIQRRADAMMELVHRQLDRGELPETSGQKPHLTLTADLATLRQEPGSRAAELDWGQPIPAETLRRLSCDCALTVVGVGTGGEPLSMGRTRRTIPPSLRRALKVRDRHCRFPGCDRPVEWTDAHHFIHWVDGGETSLKNCLLMCRPHHMAVHERGWKLFWGDGGELLAMPPIGHRARAGPSSNRR